jgi:hypothetical protein
MRHVGRRAPLAAHKDATLAEHVNAAVGSTMQAILLV